MKKKLLIWAWCFPQMLAGFILSKVTKAEKHKDHYRYNITHGSVSLGEYVFLCPLHWKNERILKHELGHVKQSRLLGWLYLIIIGLPSIIWAGCFQKYRNKHKVDYYSFYTEKWADSLGGVNKK